MGRLTTRRAVVRIDGAATLSRPDTLAVEEPLEVRVAGDVITVTMRTPGDDMDLAAGFLVSEGAISRTDQLVSMRFCAGSTGALGANTYNVLDVDLTVAGPTPRASYISSSCGICGSASLEAVRTATSFAVSGDPLVISRTQLATLPDRLREQQRVFDKTGGLHAAGLFSADGELLCLREDVGRHNAVDKVVGWALREGRLPLAGSVLMVSGRASFELVQKAWMAGIPFLAAVSAPSSLAVDLAKEAGMTLVGFLRGASMNVYCGEQRVL